MLCVTIPASEFYDNTSNEFIYVKEHQLRLEHSLVSIYKWESRWKKPFFNEKEEKTDEETRDYIRCMTITQNVPDLVYYAIPDDVLFKIRQYIDDPMTATIFSKREERKQTKEIATAEVIYYMMISLQIPQDWEKRHFNQLLTLIRVFEAKTKEHASGKKSKKMNRSQLADRDRLNEERLRKYNTRG